MFKALVVKELRESAGLAALAALATLFAVGTMIGVRWLPWNVGFGARYPFVNDDEFHIALWMIAGGLGGLLGLKQSAWELWQGTYHFLLHRPAGRKQIFGTKLGVGLGLLLGITGAGILAYAVWAATPGTHASPFFWSMTGGVWQVWFAMPLVYLGAFLSGMRPGHWFGSRLLPLVSALVLTFLAAYLPWAWMGVAVGLVAMAAYTTAIFLHVESRDY